MRSALVVLVVVTAAAGCAVVSLFGGDTRCTDDAACPETQPYCVNFVCTNLSGEGEGDVVGEGEGEGDVVGEGEGDVP